MRNATGRGDPFATIHSVPAHLRDVDAELVAWAIWCRGRPAANTSPMFRLFRRSYARGEYGAPTVVPPTNAPRALLIERQMRHLPHATRDVLRGWYVYGMTPNKLARRLAVRAELLAHELNRARLMVRNLLEQADAEQAVTTPRPRSVFAS